MIATANAKRPKIDYHAYGAAAELFLARELECLIAGAANTGKTRAILERAYMEAIKYPKIRIIFVRKTRVSMNQSVLKTWTNLVLPPNPPMKFSTSNQSCVFDNGSEIVLAGLDDKDAVQRLLSSEYDRIYAFEATEITENDWETMLARLRNKTSGVPFKQAVADCNPSVPSHWLKQRCNRGQMRMLISKHEDNPSITQTDLDILRRLTGIRRARFYEGRWAVAEGMVYDCWDPTVHMLNMDDVPPIRRVIGGIDWGLNNPGVLQAWGLDGDKNMYRVAEIYHTRRTIEWWIQKAIWMRDEFHVDRWIADPEDPEKIMRFRAAGINILEAKKGKGSIETGIELVYQRLSHGPQRRPTMFFVRDSLIERDEMLVEARQSWCTEQEIENYVYPKGDDGKVVKEVPEDHDDHGQDACRYVTTYLDGGISVDPRIAPPTRYVREQMGAIAGHDKAFDLDEKPRDPFA